MLRLSGVVPSIFGLSRFEVDVRECVSDSAHWGMHCWRVWVEHVGIAVFVLVPSVCGSFRAVCDDVLFKVRAVPSWKFCWCSCSIAVVKVEECEGCLHGRW